VSILFHSQESTSTWRGSILFNKFYGLQLKELIKGEKMQARNHKEFYEFSIELIIHSLKSKDKTLIQFCVNEFSTIIDSEFAEDILMAAMLQLVEADAETFYWGLKHFYNIESYMRLVEKAALLATQKLIQKGLILGKDFSILNQRKLLITEEAKAVLLESISTPNSLLLQRIFQQNNSSYLIEE
jgi:hypothetical protein